MKQSTLILAALFVCFVVHSANANIYSLDFETESDGVTTPTAGNSAASEYSSLGVTFKGGNFAGQPVFYKYESLGSMIADLPPGDNKWLIMTASKTTGPGTFFDMDILFSDDVFDVSGDVVFNPGYKVTATAFDDYDNILYSSVIPAGNSSWIGGSFHFISSTTPIARIQLLPNDERVAVGLDNLVTPVPGAALLGILGLGVAIGKLRKFT